MTSTLVRTTARPEVLTHLTDHLTDHAHLIEFPDHSVFADFPDAAHDAAEDSETGGPVATLADMSDTLWASNNCDTASTAVQTETQTLTGNTMSPGLVELIWTGDDIPARHYATTITIEGTIWILDYTARQFDPLLPYPLVAPLDEWTEVIAEAVETEWGWTNPVPHLH